MYNEELFFYVFQNLSTIHCMIFLSEIVEELTGLLLPEALI